LSFAEKETAARVAEEWKSIGAEITSNVGGHGVVGILKNGEGPVLLLRTDLDALPVVEATNLAFASKVKVKDAGGNEVGVMHACGHDVHITNLIGVARYLAANKDKWKGTLFLLGQPAEERGAGAQAMLEDGLFKRFPKPTMAVALHCDPNLAAGVVSCRGGYTLANVDNVDIIVRGRGGHGAHPESTIDPIVQGAELVLALQTIVSREIKATEPAVVTVGAIRGGTKHNVIGDSCHLQLTLRSYSDEVRKHLIDAVTRKAKAVAASHRAPEPTVHVVEGTPSLFNDVKLAERIRGILETTLKKDHVVEGEPSMGGEDFSRYGRAGVPILMYRLGTTDSRRAARLKELGQEAPPLHSPFYYPDVEQSLSTGLISMSRIALELLKP
jgi:hippurate hydrolase